MGKCKSSRKIREKAVMKIIKTFQPKTTLHLPTLFQLPPRQVHGSAQLTTPQKTDIVVTQTFDDDQTLSISRINITKPNAEH